MTDDSELLRQYADEDSEAAFRELVQRHIDFVYAAALRQARGNAPVAEDVTQVVFTDLSRKAEKLKHHHALVGWLHTATRFATSKAIRAESRRRAREQEVHLMNDSIATTADPIDWERVKPVLDEVVGNLKERERVAILLRYFQHKSLAEVGVSLSLSETAARSVVDRALERMRCLLARRGITSTATALGLALAHQSAFAAPAGLAVAVSTTALAAGTASSAGAGAAFFMGMTKIQAVAASVVALAGTTTLLIQAHGAGSLREALAAVHQHNGQAPVVQARTIGLERELAEAEALRVRSAEVTALRKEAAAIRSKLGQGGDNRANRQSRDMPPFNGVVHEPADVDVRPNARFQARPNYPAALRRLNIGGRATVEFVVDESGWVRNAKVIDATHPDFGDAALEAVRQWEYEPGRKEGASVAVRVKLPMNFTMEMKSTMGSKIGTSGEQKGQATLPWF